MSKEEVKKWMDRYNELYNKGYPDLKKKVKELEKDIAELIELGTDQTVTEKIVRLEKENKQMSKILLRIGKQSHRDKELYDWYCLTSKE